jgi:hypothetical protein
MDCPFYFVVEETEVKKYKKLKLGKVLTLPFHDLGQGSIPARNWIWEHAKEHGHKRHWVMDDNIVRFFRTNYNNRIPVRTAAIFRCMEEWADRYTNVAFCGPHHIGFVTDRQPNQAPFTLNSRIYSCILVNTKLSYRWRGRYNEDTDLCLRALKDGWCTCLFRAFLMNKGPTMKQKGGNTDNVYNTGDHRRAFAESLQKQHPDVVKVVWKFKRWHHQVDYSPFKRNKPKLKKGITPLDRVNEHGMRLVYIGKEGRKEE